MKTLLFFLLISTLTFGQLTQDSLQSIAKSYFENTYVKNNFKDSYSYELKKIWSEPITKEENLRNSIISAEMIINNRNIPKSMKEDWKKQLNDYTGQYSKLTPEESKIVVGYNVFFDTYGANSYGNKVLGKYKLVIDVDGKSISEVESLN